MRIAEVFIVFALLVGLPLALVGLATWFALRLVKGGKRD